MSRSAISLFVFAIYMILVGVLGILFPGMAVGSSGPSGPGELYVRTTGIFGVVLASYLILAARHEWVEFFRWSIYTRLVVVVVFIAFVQLGYAGPSLLLYTPFDLLGAIWTAWALRSEHVPLLVSQSPA